MNEGHKLLKKGDKIKGGLSMKNMTTYFLRVTHREKNITSNEESNPERSVSAI